jgi:hypothetical protein
MDKSNTEERSCNHCCSGKAVRITYSECVCVCSISYLACNAHAPYCHLWPVRPYNIFSTLFHEWHDFRKNIIEHKMCAWILSSAMVCNIAHSKTN